MSPLHRELNANERRLRNLQSCEAHWVRKYNKTGKAEYEAKAKAVRADIDGMAWVESGLTLIGG